MEKYLSLVSIGFAAWAITATSALPGAAQERPAVRHDIEAWVKSYRRGLPEAPTATRPKTHLPRAGKSVGRPPSMPAGPGAGGAADDERLPTGRGRASLPSGGEQ